MPARYTHRSKTGCCICGVKSSASRFSNYEKIVSKLDNPESLLTNGIHIHPNYSNNNNTNTIGSGTGCSNSNSNSNHHGYQQHYQQSTKNSNVSAKLSGDICNACSLYIKRELKKTNLGHSRKGKLFTRSQSITSSSSGMDNAAVTSITYTKSNFSSNQNNYSDVSAAASSCSYSDGRSGGGSSSSGICCGKVVGSRNNVTRGSGVYGGQSSSSICTMDTQLSDDTMSLSSHPEQHSITSDQSGFSAPTSTMPRAQNGITK